MLTGIPPTATAKISILDIVFHQKKIAGSIVGGRAVTNEMLTFCAVNKIKPQLQVSTERGRGQLLITTKSIASF